MVIGSKDVTKLHHFSLQAGHDVFPLTCHYPKNSFLVYWRLYAQVQKLTWGRGTFYFFLSLKVTIGHKNLNNYVDTNRICRGPSPLISLIKSKIGLTSHHRRLFYLYQVQHDHSYLRDRNLLPRYQPLHWTVCILRRRMAVAVLLLLSSDKCPPFCIVLRKLNNFIFMISNDAVKKKKMYRWVRLLIPVYSRIAFKSECLPRGL